MSVHKVTLSAALVGMLFASAMSQRMANGADRDGAAESAATKFEKVELFEAMKNGTIDVKFIPADSRSANVIIKNKTDKPLTIKLPDAFAGVQVLAQMGGMGMGGGMGGGMGMGGMGGGMGMGGGGQSMGGGMGGMGGMGGGGMGGFGGGGMGGMGGMGGFFNVGPEKDGKFKVTTVCLEHGKTEPNPRMKYTIQPIDTVTSDPRVIEMCKSVGRGDISQNVAQAAVWHVANGLSWEELAAKDRVRSRLGTVKYFTPQEMNLAQAFTSVVSSRTQAPALTQVTSPGDLPQNGKGQ